MREPGPLLAAGRDADIFEYGPGLVLRRSRQGRDLSLEARVMEFVRTDGFPVPAVEEVSGDGTTMVMERIEGVSMVDAMAKRPWSLRRHGALLGDLHRRLHQIAAPEWLPDAPVGAGDRLVHMDLHPLNVMVGPHGATVIDWTGASAGEPAVDVAVAWVLIASGEVPLNRLVARVMHRARGAFIGAFLAQFDRAQLEGWLHQVVAWKVQDPHMSQLEQARMWALADTVGT
ncbi:MAG TPA: phosphotransferase [Acidimicrobiales bacterium]|nr:phosphotransferase [Acidimicrobiales bacterium]